MLELPNNELFIEYQKYEREYERLTQSMVGAGIASSMAQYDLDDFLEDFEQNGPSNDREVRLQALNEECEYHRKLYNSNFQARQEFKDQNQNLITSWESTLIQQAHKAMDKGQANFEQDKEAEINRSNAALQQWAKAHRAKHETKPTLCIQSDVEGVLIGDKKSKILKINPRFVHTVKQMQKHARVILDINSIIAGELGFSSEERHNEFYKNLKDLVPDEKILQVSGGTLYEDGKPTAWNGTYQQWVAAGFKGNEELYNAAGINNAYNKAAIALVLMMYRRDVLNEPVKEYRNFFVDNTLKHVEAFHGINHTGKYENTAYIRTHFQDLGIKPFHTVGIQNYIDYMGVTQPTGQELKKGTNWQDSTIRDVYGDFKQHALDAQNLTGYDGEGKGTLSEINSSGTLHNLPLAFVQKERKVDMQVAQHNMTLPGDVHDDYKSIKDMALNYDPFNLNEIFNDEELKKINYYFEGQWQKGKTHTIDDIKFLLKLKSIDANVADKKGVTPLIWAVQNGEKDLVDRLLKMDGIDVNKQDEAKCSPLMHATINSNSQEGIIASLKAKSAVLDVAGSAGETALLYATRNGKLDRAKKILEIDGINVNARDKHGYTPLMWAALHGTGDVVKHLIAKGADVNAKNSFNATPLTLAQELKSGTEKDKIVKVLEAQQQNLMQLNNIKELSNTTAQRNKIQINTLQDNYCSNPTQASLNNVNPLLQQKNDELPDAEKIGIKTMIEKDNKGDVNKILSDDGTTLLSACVASGDWRAAKYLIDMKSAQIPTDKKAVEKLKQSIIQCKVTLDELTSSNDSEYKRYHNYSGTAGIPKIAKFIQDKKLDLNTSAEIDVFLAKTYLENTDCEALALHLITHDVSEFNLLRLFYPYKRGDVPIERLKNINNESYNEIIQIPQVANLIDKYNLKHKPVALPQRSQTKNGAMRLQPIAVNNKEVILPKVNSFVGSAIGAAESVASRIRNIIKPVRRVVDNQGQGSKAVLQNPPNQSVAKKQVIAVDKNAKQPISNSNVVSDQKQGGKIKIDAAKLVNNNSQNAQAQSSNGLSGQSVILQKQNKQIDKNKVLPPLTKVNNANNCKHRKTNGLGILQTNFR